MAPEQPWPKPGHRMVNEVFSDYLNDPNQASPDAQLNALVLAELAVSKYMSSAQLFTKNWPQHRPDAADRTAGRDMSSLYRQDMGWLRRSQ